MAKRPTYSGLFKIANKLSLGKCECGRDIVVDVELAGSEEESAEQEMDKTAAAPTIHEEESPEEESWDAEEHFDEEESDSDYLELTESEEDMLNSDEHPADRKVTASKEESLIAFVKKASSIVDQLDTVAGQVESTNPRLAARIDAVSNEIEKRVARILQRRQNTK